MRRIIRILIPALLVAGLSAVGGAATAASRTAAQPTAGCTGAVVAITQLGFVPSSVAPGQNSNLTGTLTNCTAEPLAVTELIAWQFLGTARNCFVNDPYYRPVTLPANGSLSLVGVYMVAGTCTASGVQVNVQITDSGYNMLAQASAQLAIEQPKPVVACHVAYTVQSEWQGGFTAAVSISNTGEVGVSGWALTLTFGGDQQLGTVWGATGSQNGAVVTLRSLDYDATIAPGQTISGIGFTGTWTNSDATPTGFNINGTLCS